MTTIQGKVAVVTGANSGLGKAAAQGLAELGATVVMVCRSKTRGEAARNEIIAATGNPSVDLLLADLSSQKSIHQLVQDFKAKYERLDALINNAAVFKRNRELSADGMELMFATNHMGYFTVTLGLLDLLKASAPARILNVSAPSTVKLNFGDLQGEHKFSALQAFGASKAANLLFTVALARRLEGSGVLVNAYHPGIVRSGLMQEARVPMRWFLKLVNLTAVAPEKAAEGLVALATQGGAGTGGFFRGQKPITFTEYVRDQGVQDRLWAESERLAVMSSSKSA